MPTLAEFIRHVSAPPYNAQRQSVQRSVVGPRGKATIDYLRRTLPNGPTRIAIVPDISDDDRLTPTQLRSLCYALDILPEDFNLSLGLVGIDSDDNDNP